MVKFFKSKKVRNSRNILQELFGGRASKSIANLLKGDMAKVGINHFKEEQSEQVETFMKNFLILPSIVLGWKTTQEGKI